MNFLIIHGSYGHPEENWFPWLKQELEKLGHNVEIPRFPTPDNQNIENWTKVIEQLKLPFDDNLIIVAHSIAPAFVLNLLETRKCKACFFVSGFYELLGVEKYDKYNRTFVAHAFNWDIIKRNCRTFFMYHGDNDPHVPLKYAYALADKLGIKLKVIKNGGHLNEVAGFTTFPMLLEDIKKVIL